MDATDPRVGDALCRSYAKTCERFEPDSQRDCAEVQSVSLTAALPSCVTFRNNSCYVLTAA